ncbi:MAG: hypothetical protein WDN67_00350 [Candidatus Moraniibacteriota bacterium]
MDPKQEMTFEDIQGLERKIDQDWLLLGEKVFMAGAVLSAVSAAPSIVTGSCVSKSA